MKSVIKALEIKSFDQKKTQIQKIKRKKLAKTKRSKMQPKVKIRVEKKIMSRNQRLKKIVSKILRKVKRLMWKQGKIINYTKRKWYYLENKPPTYELLYLDKRSVYHQNRLDKNFIWIIFNATETPKEFSQDIKKTI